MRSADTAARTSTGTKAKRGPIAVTLVAFALLVLVIGLLVAQPALADVTGFDARPLPGSPNAELGYFKFDGDPGAAVDRVVVITNLSGSAKVVRLAPCDGLAGVFGGVTYSESDKDTLAVGSWIRLSTDTVEIPAGASVEVPFTVRVPSDVSSGLHLGGIAMWEPAAATTSGSSSGDGTGASVVITSVTRVVLTVLVNTPGPSAAVLTVGAVRPDVRSDGVYLLIPITNTGTGATKGQGTISIGSDGMQQTFDVGDMIPGSSTDYPVKWKADPKQGAYQTDVRLSYGKTGQVAQWSGPVTIGEAEVESPWAAPEASQQAAPGGQNWMLYGGWAFAGILVLAAGALGIHRLRGRHPVRTGPRQPLSHG